MNNPRGYFGIGIYRPKNELNIGTLWRTANIMGASFIFTIGRRYRRQASDTYSTPKHVPMFHFETFEDFKKHLPHGCPIVAVELDESSEPVESFKHPERAAYLLGAEDDGIPPKLLAECHRVVQLPGERSMNVSVAGSIVLYDRVAKGKK